MKKIICASALILSLLLTISLMPLIAARADSEINVLQVYITEQTLSVFIDRGLRTGGLSCAISNQNAEITQSGQLSDEGALTKTTIVLDVSAAMPNAVRNAVISALNKLVETKSANEEFKIVAFGDEPITLHDFSDDRYDLANAIENIRFDGTQSQIYDAIYNTIPRITSTDSRPTFFRTIVITDGNDDTASVITREELFITLQNEYYPVDVVAVSGGADAENRDLSAIVRISGGRYFPLNPSTDVTTLAQALGVGGYYYIEARIPAALLDGTTRQVDIDDGGHRMSVDVKFPVFNAPIDDAASTSDTEDDEAQPSTQTERESPTGSSPSPSASPEQTATTVQEQTDTSESNTFGGGVIIIIIAVGAALIIMAIIIVIMKAKKKGNTPHTKPAAEVKPGNINDKYREDTEFVGNDYTNARFVIKLSDPNDPGRAWMLPVNGDLLIGRAEHCTVRFDDRSVSREQCKISVADTGLVLTHLGSSNKTTLNGSTVASNSPLKSGDIIKFGRERLCVDYIQSQGDLELKPAYPRNSDGGMTESIF